jgi:hypothetical protein
MRRIGLTCAVLLGTSLPACAPGAAREGGAGPGIRVVPSGGGAEIFQQSDARPSETVIFAAVDTAWRALTAAYQQLGIPLSTVDRASYLLGNAAHAVQGRLGEEPPARYFSCGSNMAGELANTARLRVNVFSQLTSHPEGALLRTIAQATASNPQGASADPVLCRSTGRLEGWIGNAVRLRVLQR